jgi:hypothetical protein
MSMRVVGVPAPSALGAAIGTAEIEDDAVTAAKLADTAVTPGSYVTAAVTVDQQGRITSAATGYPYIAATVALNAQAAAIGATALLASAAVGVYRATVYHEITQAASVSSSTQVTVTHTAAAVVNATASNITANTVGSRANNAIPLIVASTSDIQYSVSYASVGAPAMQYGLRIVLERLA